MHTHSIIQSGLDMTCTMRSSPVKICDTDSKRLYASLEVRANRGGKYPELIFVSRFYTDDRICPKHIGTDIRVAPEPKGGT